MRTRARKKFPTLELPYLFPRGLEQASGELAAREHARRIAHAARDAVLLDATCGLGADLVALGLAGVRCVGADLDVEALSCAHANLSHHALPTRVLRADATRPAARAELWFVDPDRRVGGERSLDPRRWSPSLDAALKLAAGFAGAGLKLAPALEPRRLVEAEQALPNGTPRRREWVSRGGELVEVMLWTGQLAHEPCQGDQRAALRLEASGVRHEFLASPLVRAPLPPQAAREAAFLADPDPAIVRSGLLGALAAAEGLSPLATELGYLGGERPSTSPFLRCFRVLGSAPLDRKRVRSLLAQHDVGPLAVRKRGHAKPAEVLAREFRGPGSRRGELVVARLDSGHRAFLVEPVVGDEGLEPPTSSL